MPRETERSPQQREDEGAQLSRAAQSDRGSEREPEHEHEHEKHLEHDEEREDIEAELEDLQEMEGPDA
jgi:hypothetical protein